MSVHVRGWPCGLLFMLDGWGKVKLEVTTLPRIVIHVSRQFNSIAFTTQRKVAYPSVPMAMTAVRAVLTGGHRYYHSSASYRAAVVYGCVSDMSNRLDPWGSGAVEITTGKTITYGSVGLAQAHPLTIMHKKTAFRRNRSSYALPCPFRRWYSDVTGYRRERVVVIMDDAPAEPVRGNVENARFRPMLIEREYSLFDQKNSKLFLGVVWWKISGNVAT